MKLNFRKSQRGEELRALLKRRVLVLDGAMGTALQARRLTAKDFGGDEQEGCNEVLVLTRPDVIEDVHRAYAEAGADIFETNTFGGTPLVLGEFGLSAQAYEINKRAAEIARKVALQFSSPEKPRFVAGSMGPTTKALSVTGGATFEELIDQFQIQAEALLDGGVDYFLIETSQDTRNIKAALLGIDRAFEKKGESIPIAVSGTIEPMGTMLAGQTAEALSVSLEHRDLLYLGLNCATGPEFMTDSIRSLSGLAPFPIACVPNAGLPDEDGRYLETPEMMVNVLKRFGESGWLNLIGGCCGTTALHIRAFSVLAEKISPRVVPEIKQSTLSGIDYLEVSEESRPILVGERTNVIGSRIFKGLISDEKFEEGSEIARRQIKNQAQIIDICLANPDRDEFADMKRFLEILIKKVTVPLMIDSTDSRVIEMALTYSQGKAIINSINLEDGEERFEQVCPLAKKFGAALIVGCIDDDPAQGMGVSLERKIEIAERSYDLLTKKYGIRPFDIYWDALVFPCGTGDRQYMGSAVHTIEGVRKLKEKFPGTKTVLGISNISFGLPTAGREVLNSVFLYHCTKAGLDLAIVNSEKLERFAEIPSEEIKLCDDLLWNKGEDPIGAFNAHFGTKKSKISSKEARLSLPLEERLSRAVVEGSKDGLIDDLNEALKKDPPLGIINGPLMKGMDEVGRLFNQNQLIVAEVLQSAEVMKTAVDHLKPFMEKNEGSLRGRIVLATVKGDVHDIGKNLVEIILSNNGFEVINLGIKIPSNDLITAHKKYSPQIIGLSGLLVKSAEQMVETASDLKAAGVNVPILVGGAALTRNFVDRKIAPAYGSGTVEYAKDAMDGLDLAKQIVDRDQFESLQKKLNERRTELLKKATTTSSSMGERPKNFIKISPQISPPPIPDLERHRLSFPLPQVWSYINPLMLLGRHLGLKGEHIRVLESQDSVRIREASQDPSFLKAMGIWENLNEIKKDALQWMQARAVYQFFRAESKGDSIRIFGAEAGARDIEWKFQRQKADRGLCLADFVNPAGAPTDHLGIFVTSVEGPVKEKAEAWKNEGNYFKSHALLALALETAEATAELLHSLLRAQWGFQDSPETTMMERFQAKYRGKRYSFGYPACPQLEHQTELFELLRPSDIGVQLTEGFMMSPEHSVSAIVFSHPDAVYFGVK